MKLDLPSVSSRCFAKAVAVFDTKTTLVLTLLILILGSFLRVYHLEQVYSENDDIGVISVYKQWEETEKQEKTLFTHPMVKVSYRVDPDYEKRHLLDSPFFPIQVALSSTYPPGQYMLYPLLISESDSFSVKHFKARGISAGMGILGLFLFVYLLYLIEGKKVSATGLLPLCVVAFSANTILYSHHMSPYVSLIASYALALVFFHKTLTKDISITRLFLLLGILTVFNYLIVLLVPIFGLVLAIQNRLFRPTQLFSSFWKGCLWYGAFFLPLLVLFLKTDQGMRGVLPLSFSHGVFEVFRHLATQFFLAFSSVIASVTSHPSMNIGLSIGIVLISGFVFYKQGPKMGENRYFFAAIYLFLLEWILLYQAKKLIMDQTRHMLMWVVVAGLLLYLSLLGKKKNKTGLYVVTCVVIGLSVITNLRHIQSKTSVFDYAAIVAQKPELVISLDNSNSNLYFENTGIPVKPLFEPDLFDAYFQQKKNWPDKIILVSQETTFADFQRKRPGNPLSILETYTLQVIQETSTGTKFPYNNYPVSSNENGFYLYILMKKQAASP